MQIHPQMHILLLGTQDFYSILFTVFILINWWWDNQKVIKYYKQGCRQIMVWHLIMKNSITFMQLVEHHAQKALWLNNSRPLTGTWLVDPLEALWGDNRHSFSDTTFFLFYLWVIGLFNWDLFCCAKDAPPKKKKNVTCSFHIKLDWRK